MINQEAQLITTIYETYVIITTIIWTLKTYYGQIVPEWLLANYQNRTDSNTGISILKSVYKKCSNVRTVTNCEAALVDIEGRCYINRVK